MSEPSVCAILLTADRPEMTWQAVACFKMQTASCERAGIKQRMLILDTSEACPDELLDKESNVLHIYRKISGLTIGELRNHAIQAAVENWKPVAGPDILIHWDSDDYSHPNRISEQVALLQSSGADVVGYNQMLFWRGSQYHKCADETQPGEAWLYQNADTKYALGTSLCYWRRTWERRPFDATSSGEDERFIRGLKVAAHSSLIHGLLPIENGPTVGEYMPAPMNAGPRMIARIHGSNTSGAYKRESMEREARRVKNPMWKRTPEWDKFCAETMRL